MKTSESSESESAAAGVQENYLTTCVPCVYLVPGVLARSPAGRGYRYYIEIK